MNPLGILAILQREYQDDFRFTRQGLDRTLGADIRRIDLIRLRPPQTNQTTTMFEIHRELQIRVPVEMEDEVGNFRGHATYSNFRRFKVRTESTIDDRRWRSEGVQ